MKKEKFEKIILIAYHDESVKQKLNITDCSPVYFLNYIVPAEFYVSEIPMHINDTDQSSDHFLPVDFDKTKRYKIIYTIIETPEDSQFSAKNIFTSNVSKKPVLEVWLDAENKKVIDIKDPPKSGRYQTIPMPVF